MTVVTTMLMTMMLSLRDCWSQIFHNSEAPQLSFIKIIKNTLNTLQTNRGRRRGLHHLTPWCLIVLDPGTWGRHMLGGRHDQPMGQWKFHSSTMPASSVKRPWGFFPVLASQSSWIGLNLSGCILKGWNWGPRSGLMEKNKLNGIIMDNCIYIGLSPCPVTVTTRTIICLVGDPYKPSFATVTGRGPHPTYYII